MIDQLLIVLFFVFLVCMSWRKKNDSFSINSFAIGNREFSTFALSSTIIATWVSGSGLALDLIEFKKNGIVYFLESIAMCLNLLIFGYFIIPKMQGFLGTTSVATYMSNEYNAMTGNFAAVLGCITSMGGIAIQFKLMGVILCYFFTGNQEFEYLFIIISSLIIVFYTYSGGIRSVVATDKIQTICFSLSLIVAIIFFNTHNENNSYLVTSSTREFNQFSFSHLFELNNSQIMDFIFVSGYFLIPGLKPQVLQRVSMAINLRQAQKAYYWGGLVLFIVLCFSCYLSYLIYLFNPEITDDKILNTLIDSFSFPFLKAILIIGIISMCMSTADSNLNISSVLLANDTYLTKNYNSLEKLYLARKLTVIIGIISIYFALQGGSLFAIILFAASFYLPIMSVPILMTIFKFKTTNRCCNFTIITCLILVLICHTIIKPNFDINFIGMIFNLVVMVSSHYIVEKWEWFKIFGITSHLKK